jgi:hypothetical protein
VLDAIKKFHSADYVFACSYQCLALMRAKLCFSIQLSRPVLNERAGKFVYTTVTDKDFPAALVLNGTCAKAKLLSASGACGLVCAV